MRRKAYFVVLLVCGILLIGAGRARPAEAPAKVEGTWDVVLKSERGTFNRTLRLKQDGSTIKGTVTGTGGTSPLEGSVSSNQIKFTVKRQTPSGIFTMEYTGTVDGDSMKGTTQSGGVSGEWTATRAE